MKTVAIHSQKGGVGKTSMTINLAHKAMEFGFETLVIDLDPQGSATFFLGQGQATKLKAKQWLSHEIDWNRYIEATPYEGVFILPARKGLRKLDRLMSSDVSDKHIKRLLKSLKSQFDLVLIDCPPGINTVIEQAYRAADRVLVPLTPTPLCLESFRTLREFVDDVAIPSAKLAPFFNRVNPRLELHRASLKQFAQNAGEPQLGWVRATTLIEKMAIDKKAVTDSHPAHRVSRDINAMWKVLMRDLDLHH
ncbi:ParA family protein [Saccharospirillum salsuginis]|uniref:Cobyrinic acid a,c-diamide synthase n=1 Tax=Saccharospirillum salsuginis TaxID=418750 RepID=A0A918K1T3_9GAMM|nr:ParA family protein [Saccharospirillum salsuginis]GGX41526.1 cobyrinic acid a,c-diamide synthase [Saccharospirillum salsuginis]